MKVFAVAAALLASAASAADCDVTVLAPLLEETYVAQCSTDTGFQFVPPSVPSEEVLAKVCDSDACKQTLAKLESFGLGDCLLLSTLYLETDLINPINTACGFSSSASGSATESSTGSSSAAVGSGVAASTASGESSAEVETPAPSSSSGEASASESATGETEAPTASSASSEATPTPTPTDNGAAQQTVAITAAAVAVAVAAAL